MKKHRKSRRRTKGSLYRRHHCSRVFLACSDFVSVLAGQIVKLLVHVLQLLLHFVKPLENLLVSLIVVHKNFPHKGLESSIYINSFGIYSGAGSISAKVKDPRTNIFSHYLIVNKVSENTGSSFY
jgi:hypothetical protein